jgi:hypothetical protein
MSQIYQPIGLTYDNFEWIHFVSQDDGTQAYLRSDMWTRAEGLCPVQAVTTHVLPTGDVLILQARYLPDQPLWCAPSTVG